MLMPSMPSRVAFNGGNVSYNDVKSMCESMVPGPVTASPTAGGTLTLNGVSLGSYDYLIKRGAQTVSSFTNTDWFTTTADSRSAFIVVDGDLTINSGQTFIPSNRKLFTVIFVRGNLAVAGSISMSARGGNHSATGSSLSAAAVRIATGTFSGVADPQVPAAGGGGGASQTTVNTVGNTGTAGTAGGTGGGGGNANRASSTFGRAGSAGTSFSGGPGAGGADSATANPGAPGTDGGVGGAASVGAGAVATEGAGGGAGNPGGAGAGLGSSAGVDGTGGVLIIICTGTFSGAGSVVAAGSNGGAVSAAAAASAGGGGSGGGSITIMAGADTGPTPSAAGGAGGVASGGTGYNGGAGGAGTARKLAL